MNTPQDKKKRFVAGFAITAVVSLFFGYIIGALAAIVAGAAKEAYDKTKGKGKPGLLGFVATVTGATAAVATSVAVSWFFSVVIAT